MTHHHIFKFITVHFTHPSTIAFAGNSGTRTKIRFAAHHIIMTSSREQLASG
jgi:hypothetical protein